MKQIINKEIKLPKELINVDKDKLKAIDIIKFLVNIEGIEYNKNLSLKELSLGRLTFDGFEIISAQINDTKKIIILTGLKDNN